MGQHNNATWYRSESYTTEPIGAQEEGSTASREFGRIRDVEHIFGLKRGTIYNLLRKKRIRGVLLRVQGRKSGVRLIELQSVRSYLQSQFPPN